MVAKTGLSTAIWVSFIAAAYRASRTLTGCPALRPGRGAETIVMPDSRPFTSTSSPRDQVRTAPTGLRTSTPFSTAST